PALLAILGPKVDSWRIPLINSGIPGQGAGFWHPLTTMVMTHPWRVLLPAALFLVLLGVPFLHIRLGSDVTALPKTAESRRGMELLVSEFHKVDTNPIIVVVRYPNSPPPSPLSVDRVE